MLGPVLVPPGGRWVVGAPSVEGTQRLVPAPADCTAAADTAAPGRGLHWWLLVLAPAYPLAVVRAAPEVEAARSFERALRLSM